ncbi:MAG: hypothetical protein LIP77_04555 [Planctomycetes bacterium]|nr:hypothetical protein [Planctomycetota bacterium]
MATDDFDDDEGDAVFSDMAEEMVRDAASGREEATTPFRNWLNAKRGWILLCAFTLAQGMFAVIMISLRANARPVEEAPLETVQDLATEMLGHEVAFREIYQYLPASGGRRVSLGMELVLVLGQLPEERVEGADRPTPAELEVFITAIRDLEPNIRNRLNGILNSVPADELGSLEVNLLIKSSVRDMVNDALDGMFYGGKVRPHISRRRVTEVLIPMFLRQVR